jgi:hypothetical protein
MTEEKEEYDLKQSVKGLGQLLPIVRDAKGRIADGFHREQEDKEWWSVTNPNIKTDQDLELARLAANFCRRKVLASEMMQRIGFLIESGLKPEEICEKTGISRTTVYKYMPQELKQPEKVHAGSQPNRTVTIQDTQAERVQCPKCLNFFSTDKVKEIDGKAYCLKCAPFVHAKPIEKIQNGVRLEKPKESYAFVKARMETPVSYVDEEVLKRLHSRLQASPAATGWHIEFQKEYVLTKSDLSLVKDDGSREIAVFNDSPLHRGKQADKDEKARDILTDRGIEVLPLPFKGRSDKEIDELVAKAEEALKW